jgi:hypothetical protein
VPRAVERALEDEAGEEPAKKQKREQHEDTAERKAKPKSGQTQTATAAALEALTTATADLKKAASAAAGAVAAASDAQALEDGVTDQGGLGSCAYLCEETGPATRPGEGLIISVPKSGRPFLSPP